MCIHATHTTPFFPLLSSLSYLVILTSFRLLTCHHVQFGATDAELQGLSLAEDDRPPPLPFGIPGAFSPEFKDEEAAAVAAARPPPLPFDDPGVMPAAKPSTPRRRSADGKLQVKGIVMHCALSLCEGHLHYLVLLASDCAHTITVCLPIINLTCHKHTHHYTYVNHSVSRQMPRQQSQSVHPRKGGEKEGSRLSIFPRPEYFGKAPERATVDATTQRITQPKVPYNRSLRASSRSIYYSKKSSIPVHVCSTLRLMFDRVGAPMYSTYYQD